MCSLYAAGTGLEELPAHWGKLPVEPSQFQQGAQNSPPLTGAAVLAGIASSDFTCTPSSSLFGDRYFCCRYQQAHRVIS